MVSFVLVQICLMIVSREQERFLKLMNCLSVLCILGCRNVHVNIAKLTNKMHAWHFLKAAYLLPLLVFAPESDES